MLNYKISLELFTQENIQNIKKILISIIHHLWSQDIKIEVLKNIVF